MDKDVILHEPSVALYGGAGTGFELYEKLIEQILSTPLLGKEGLGVVLFIEIGFDQKKVAINYLNSKKLNFKIFKDNGGVDRCIKIEF
ncbi:MAG: hypothetical protein Q9M97_01350 [Candidatus Gracilibacteria bacterium]|nr:hypothetical protein [Candidatus Gracilibacteria bacterium]